MEPGEVSLWDDFSAKWRQSLRLAIRGFLVACVGAVVSIIAMIPGLGLLGVAGYVVVAIGVAMGFFGIFGAFVRLFSSLLKLRK